MWILTLLLVAVVGGRSAHVDYWPLSSTTSILVESHRIGTWGPGPDNSYVTLYGNGVARITDDSTSRYTTRYRWVSPLVTARLVDKLAQLDFLHLKCTKPWDIDHFTAVDVTLVAPGGRHQVGLIHCSHDVAARLREVVDEVEALAKRWP